VVILNPGAGFGTGTHETTQLCLQAFAEGLEKGCSVSSVLDFGSGSGILAIGAAIRGARVVHAVEIDPLAVDNARENARLNGASERVTWASDLSGLNELRPTDGYSVVFANILRPVLLEFVDQLTARISAQGMLILSGLIESDLDLVIQAYSARLAGFHLRVLSKNEWRALVFERNLWLCAVRERVK
jgi:ribosomal protein L11 methyltransferase